MALYSLILVLIHSVEPTTLRLKAIDSTNARPRPTLMLHQLFFQTLLSIPKVAFAFFMRTFISLSQLLPAAIQGWTGVSKAARENVRNGPKFAKTIYLSIGLDNRPSKLRFGTALVLRISSGVNLVWNLGRLWIRVKNSIFLANFRKFRFF